MQLRQTTRLITATTDFVPTPVSHMMFTGDGLGFDGLYRAGAPLEKPRPIQLMGKLAEESFELRQQLKIVNEGDHSRSNAICDPTHPTPPSKLSCAKS